METQQLIAISAPDTQPYFKPVEIARFKPPRLWYKAASLVAEGLNDGRVAEDIGSSSRTIRKWRLHPEFRRIVAAYQDRIRKAVEQTGIASSTARVIKQSKRWERLNESIEAEASIKDALPQVKAVQELEKLVAQDLGGMFTPKDTQVIVNQQFVMIPADKNQPVMPIVSATAIDIG